MDIPSVVEIAKRHDKTPAQILLRQCIQRGLVVIPKSSTPQRIRENVDVCSGFIPYFIYDVLCPTS